ncbi:MAG: zinc-ribbon domain-containing protein [Clostridia bacterium]|nr:zinc-ribbon domain-containing protein [Clostridia bacterium]
MYCSKCGKQIPENQTVCPACGTDAAPAAPTAPQPTPVKRQTFLNVFSFIVALYTAWSTVIIVLLRSGLLTAWMPQTAHPMILSMSRAFVAVGVPFCLGAALLALFSLFGKNKKKGLGATALILSCICLAVLVLPGAFERSEQSAAAPEENASVVFTVTPVEPQPVVNPVEPQPAVNPVEPQQAANPVEPQQGAEPVEPAQGGWAQQICSEDVFLTLEQPDETTCILTVDNRSDRNVNFGWVSQTTYILITTEQGRFRIDVNESIFSPVQAYTQRTVTLSLAEVSGTPQTFELINLCHLDARGLPSNGMMQGLIFAR